jgi:hypothetical protein
VFGTKGCITGVLAPELSRKAIGQALRARHTWASTGERTVGLARCEKYTQGDEFPHKGAAKIDYRFLGDAGWDEISAYDHSGLIWHRNLQQEAGYSERRIRVRFGGARIRDRYRWAAWKGTITIMNGVINRFLARGFEHKEEACWRSDATGIGFRADTYGDAEAIEIDVSNLAHCRIRLTGTIDGYVKVGNPLDGNPWVHCPNFDWEVSGAQLLEHGRLRRDLGGAEVFLAIERLADAPMPRDVSGALEIKPGNGPHGFRPVFLLARQIDDAKIWTSAMFITFRN